MRPLHSKLDTVPLTCHQQRDSFAHIDKRSRQHYVSWNSGFNLHCSKALHLVFENNTDTYFVYTTMVFEQPAGLYNEASIFAGADWLGLSVSQEVARGQFQTHYSLIEQGAGEGAVGVRQLATAVLHGGLGVPRHQHNDVDGQTQDDGAVVPKEPADHDGNNNINRHSMTVPTIFTARSFLLLNILPASGQDDGAVVPTQPAP